MTYIHVALAAVGVHTSLQVHIMISLKALYMDSMYMHACIHVRTYMYMRLMIDLLNFSDKLESTNRVLSIIRSMKSTEVLTLGAGH